MNTKVLVLLLFFIPTIPFIIYSLVADLTKRQVVITTGLAMLVGVAECFSAGRAISAWLIKPSQFIPLIGLCIAAVVTSVALQKIRARRQRRALSWTRRPSQPEFAAGCYASLLQRGWTYRDDLSRTFMDAYWLELGRDRITFIFSSGDFLVERTDNALRDSRRNPLKKVIIVVWDQPTVALVQLLDRRKWSIVPFGEFKKLDFDLVQVTAAPNSVSSRANNESSWSHLREMTRS